jgi:hypothetical protein
MFILSKLTMTTAKGLATSLIIVDPRASAAYIIHHGRRRSLRSTSILIPRESCASVRGFFRSFVAYHSLHTHNNQEQKTMQ